MVLPAPGVWMAGTQTGFHAARHASDPTRRPADQAVRLPGIPANEQRDEEVPEASTVNDAAVAAYRLSVQAGNPRSERAEVIPWATQVRAGADRAGDLQHSDAGVEYVVPGRGGPEAAAG